MRIDHQWHGLAGECVRHFEAPSQVGDGAIAPHMAADPVQEQAIELGGERAQAANARKVLLRSAEHTSELQSLMRISYAVFCLKKKNKSNSRFNRSTHTNPTKRIPHS